jgi:hypothetical protein
VIGVWGIGTNMPQTKTALSGVDKSGHLIWQHPNQQFKSAKIP